MKFTNNWIMSIIFGLIMKEHCCENISQSSNQYNTTVTEESIQLNESITTISPTIEHASSSVKSLPSLPYWMSKTENINNDLINIQAIVVKDQDGGLPCNKGERKSERRYLMCAGSILNKNYVLTSTSCLHEALHIRHNIRGSLAVAIAPLKSSVQIIRVVEYRIHPKHNANPYTIDYIKHNVAILKLECTIDVENDHRVELPNQPMMNFCKDENCNVAIYRIVGYNSNVLSQRPAPDVQSLISSKRRIKRFSDGSHFCGQTGAAVMLNATQVAIVAVSCDDRKWNSKWLYTDLYINKNWINSILQNWNNQSEYLPNNFTYSTTTQSSFGSISKNCENCIFNFYISIGCKGNNNCQNSSLNAPGINSHVKTLQWLKNMAKRKEKKHFCINNSLNCSSNLLEKLMKNTGIPGSEKPINSMDKYVKERIRDSENKTNFSHRIDGQVIQEFGRRIKRGSNIGFINKDFDDNDENIMKMQGLIVKDENASSCCTIAEQVSNHRYFMCSAAILTLKHAITTASCMHFADIYEHHIDAELALMIGATTAHVYIVKINRYEMHPNYVIDVEAKGHSTHNLAILFLACSINFDAAIIPKMPKGINDDIAHMCCSRNCSVITIIQSYDNHQLAKKLRAKNIPSPKHNDDHIIMENSIQSNIARKTIFKIPIIYPSMRERRSLGKLAAAPLLFFEDELMSVKSEIENNSKDVTKSSKKIEENAKKLFPNQYQNASIIAKILTGRIFRKVNGRRSLSNSLMIDEAINSVDWNNIEEAMERKISTINKSIINKFIENIVKETMKRIIGVFDVNGQFIGIINSTDASAVKKSNFFTTLLFNSSANRSIDDFSQALIRIITHLMPPNNEMKLGLSSEVSIDERDVGKPPPKYVECPPLGTPVIINGTLIGMIAYTCDDIQNWVKWKYVSISNNLIWLRKRLTASQHQSVRICDDIDRNQDLMNNKSDTMGL
ncbi:uncharacterized protein LOC135169032 [Diachasmimorpha longicaudata]|uniref:uncharacterized protein LOC135169032 n=1 Tax=Diachasmimorpha longicaudata TaxID=58733 RepID=UPI0030B8C547